MSSPPYLRFGIATLSVASLGAAAQDLDRGRALYETHCATCHTERLHDRQHSRVHDIDDVRDMVVRWSREVRHGFTLDELEDVAQYLNASHYHFRRRPPPAGSD